MQKRNYGIDVLKIISMLFIVILHINSNGGLFKNVTTGSKDFGIILVLEIICLCAVNIYGIISGYLSYSKCDNNSTKIYSFKRLIYLWIQVVFYSLITSLVLFGLGKIELTKEDIFKIFLPVSNRYVWYFTAYFLLFFLAPIINCFVKNSSNKMIMTVLIPIIVFFGFYQSFMIEYMGDFTYINNGYSVWWLVILFYIGAVIKKMDLLRNISSKKLLLYLFLVYVISFSWKFFVPVLAEKNDFLSYFDNFLFNYNSPSNLFAAIIWVVLLTRVTVNSKTIKSLLPVISTATFGVYVMHLHPYIWTNVINGAFTFILDYSIIFEPIIVLGIAVFCLSIMLIIDIIRGKLFKLLGVEKLCNLLERILTKLQDCFVNQIND